MLMETIVVGCVDGTRLCGVFRLQANVFVRLLALDLLICGQVVGRFMLVSNADPAVCILKGKAWLVRVDAVGDQIQYPNVETGLRQLADGGTLLFIR